MHTYEDRIPPGIKLGVVRSITYGLLGKPDSVVPQVRALGGGAVRIFLFWSQIEPEPGRYDWTAVDHFLQQLDGDIEAWVTICSSSHWATKRDTDFLPPSPAKDPEVFGAFVRKVVERCRGKVTYWQCDNEPSVPILWAGTAQEYVTQLKAFTAAVRESDPSALVVLGGAPPGALGQDAEEAAVFQHILENARDDFDIFDVHFYGDPYDIPDAIKTCREYLAAAGYQKPIVAGEYGGPVPFEFPEQAFPYLGPIIKASGGMLGGGLPDDWTSQTSDVQKRPPEHDALVAMYDKLDELPPEMRMFVPGAEPQDEERQRRWQSRDVVVRNMLALAGGVRRTLYWNLGPDVPGSSPHQLMGFLFDKLRLMDYRDGELSYRYPAADTFELTAAMLAGATAVRRHDVPDVFAFDIERPDRPPILVAWVHRPGLAGEDAPPVDFDWAWSAPSAFAVDAYGKPHATRLDNGRVSLSLSVVPVFVSPDPVE